MSAQEIRLNQLKRRLENCHHDQFGNATPGPCHFVDEYGNIDNRKSNFEVENSQPLSLSEDGAYYASRAEVWFSQILDREPDKSAVEESMNNENGEQGLRTP